MRTVILVVLYRTALKNSKTLVSLKDKLCKINGENKCIVYNNGPMNIEADEFDEFFFSNRNVSYHLINDLKNRALSHIYNEVLINHFSWNRVILLDDDTTISDSYINELNKENKNIDLMLPFIIDKEQVFYPLVDNKTVKHASRMADIDGEIYSVGSGLVIYNNLFSIFSKYKFLFFDNNFALYGVDFSFFRRINKIREYEHISIIIAGNLNHSLSRNGASYTEWRHLERLYDVVLTAKYYYSTFDKYFTLVKVILREVKHLRISCMYKAIKVYRSGVHPRCK